MKIKFILFSFCFFLVTSIGFAQKGDEPKSIINEKVAIKKYHNKEELERMQKGELLTLYVERIESLIETLPYIAFATKPGITMSTLGIPNESDNRKILEKKKQYKRNYRSAVVVSNRVLKQRNFIFIF